MSRVGIRKSPCGFGVENNDRISLFSCRATFPSQGYFGGLDFTGLSRRALHNSLNNSIFSTHFLQPPSRFWGTREDRALGPGVDEEALAAARRRAAGAGHLR